MTIRQSKEDHKGKEFLVKEFVKACSNINQVEQEMKDQFESQSVCKAEDKKKTLLKSRGIRVAEHRRKTFLKSNIIYKAEHGILPQPKSSVIHRVEVKSIEKDPSSEILQPDETENKDRTLLKSRDICLSDHKNKVSFESRFICGAKDENKLSSILTMSLCSREYVCIEDGLTTWGVINPKCQEKSVVHEEKVVGTRDNQKDKENKKACRLSGQSNNAIFASKKKISAGDNAIFVSKNYISWGDNATSISKKAE